MREILIAIGENPDREGLVNTPRRVAEMCSEIFAGLEQDARNHLTLFNEEQNDEMVTVRDIPLYSVCEHHLVPFFGTAHIAYIPREGRVIGLSKLARIVDVFARRPQLQERLTAQIADFLYSEIKPHGLAVIIEAEHLCMTMRGARAAGCRTQTSALRGLMKSDARTLQRRCRCSHRVINANYNKIVILRLISLVSSSACLTACYFHAGIIISGHCHTSCPGVQDSRPVLAHANIVTVTQHCKLEISVWNFTVKHADRKPSASRISLPVNGVLHIVKYVTVPEVDVCCRCRHVTEPVNSTSFTVPSFVESNQG